MNIYSIYKATCVITNQSYIGFDSNWPNRKKEHNREYKKQSNIKFYNAIKKYGWQNFIWEVIYNSKDGEHTLNVMESHFITEYDSMLNGYNTTGGGRRGPILFGESNGMYGKTHSNEIKKAAAIRAKQTFGGKSYEELYGFEKANTLKKIRSDNLKGKDNSGKNNPRFDHKKYTFYNIKSKETVTMNRYEFYTKYKLNKSGVHSIIKNGKIHKNWQIL